MNLPTYITQSVFYIQSRCILARRSTFRVKFNNLCERSTMKELFLCVVLAIIGGLQTATVKNPLETSLLVNKLKKEIWDKKAMKYLKTYGYIQENEDANADLVTAALKRMQTMAHVKVTGEMNEETSRSMNQERCGVPDEFPGDKNHRGRKQKRSSIPTWNKRHLTYKFVQMTRDLPVVTVRSAIMAAFESWSRHIAITFTEVINDCDPVDIEISFVVGPHNTAKFNYCKMNTDGRGNVLANAYFPCHYRNTMRNLCGDIHIDDSEGWTIEYTLFSGQPLQRAVAHEIGHALGLKHSKTRSALMYSSGGRSSPNEPTREDIARIKRLYPVNQPPDGPKSRCHPHY